MSHLAGSLLGALLPEPERSAAVRRLGGDPPRASGLLGAAQFLLGVGLVHGNAMESFRVAADEVATGFLQVASHRSVSPEDALGLTWGGAVVWLGWLLRPTTWLLLSVPAIGLLRATAYLTTRQAVAEPAVWAALRLAQLGRRAVGAASERAEMGPAARADEVDVDGDDLLVHTPRPRPDWNDAVTIEVAGRFYRVAASDLTPRTAGRRRYRYRLTPAGEHDVIRRYLRYEPPPAPEPSPAPRG